MNNDDNDDTCCPMGPHPNLLLLTGSDKVQTATKHTRRCMQERVILMRKPFLSACLKHTLPHADQTNQPVDDLPKGICTKMYY